MKRTHTSEQTHTREQMREAARLACGLANRLGKPYKLDWRYMDTDRGSVNNIVLQYGKHDPGFNVALHINREDVSLRAHIGLTNYTLEVAHTQAKTAPLEQLVAVIKSWEAQRKPTRDSIVLARTLAIAAVRGMPLALVGVRCTPELNVVVTVEHTKHWARYSLSVQGASVALMLSDHYIKWFDLADPQCLHQLRSAFRDYLLALGPKIQSA